MRQTTCESSTMKLFVGFPVLTVYHLYFSKKAVASLADVSVSLEKPCHYSGNSTAVSVTTSVQLHNESNGGSLSSMVI